jgi:RimJ/RimL family protein N-acetyltransferase
MTWPVPVTLSGAIATLEPLRMDHHDGLVDVVSDGELWNLWYTKIPAPAAVRADIERRLGLQAKGSMLPFVVIDNTSRRVVGSTTYMNIDAEHRRVEIGSTWYAKSVQRTGLNTECKRLLLAHAFETLGCIAVEFRTAFVNFQSRKAIERLGAKLDGVLRSHQLSANGTLRDTCVYSIIACEWPTVRAHLDWLMHKPRTERA